MLLRFEAWQSGRRVAQLLSDGGRLAGLFAIGTAKGGITPPWLVGDIVDILGPGPVRAAIAEARRADRRPRSPGYYDAFDAEACAAGGDDAEARRLAQSAITKLPQAEAVLIVRMRAILATLALDAGGAPGAVLSPIFERDPSLLRRRRIVVPVRIGARGALGDEVRDALARSPRFDETSSDIAISIVASTSTARICLAGARGESFGCGEATARSGENARSFVQRAVDEFHRVAFSPRVNLSQTDIASLDGSTRGTRDPLRGLRDIDEP